MNKVRSAICLTLMTLLVAALCFVCFVTFSYGTNGMNTYNSILSMTQKDADLGIGYGSKEDESDRYLGGGYSAVYYPEGVISAKEYEDNLEGAEDKQAYAAKYEQVGSLYFEKEVVTIVNGEPDEAFKTEFCKAVELFTSRYELLHSEDVRVSVVDNYAIRVFVPRSESVAFSSFLYTGELTVSYGSADSVIMPARSTESIEEYVKGAHVRVSNGNYYVVVDFTAKGREALKKATAGAADSSSTVYFRVGDESALELSVSQQIDQKSLFISNSSFTKAAANTRAILIDTALKGEQTELSFTLGDTMSYHALYGDTALPMLYIALGACMAAMMIFFFARYGALGFAHLFTYVIFTCCTLLCVWAIPFLTLSVETVTAFLLTSVLLSVSTAATFESARKEYALGKTMTSSVKAGYKKCMWHLFDLHIIVALVGFFTYFVALAPLSGFAFTLGLTAVFSGLGSLILTRFNWAIMMAYTRKKGAFCNFKREEVEDE